MVNCSFSLSCTQIDDPNTFKSTITGHNRTPRKETANLSIAVTAATNLASSSTNKEAAPPKKVFKSVPGNYKVLSENKYHQVVSDLESVLLDISTDGVGINTPDGNISASTLKRWAESLRNALETLSKA